jgi:hypothetical protein
MDLPQQQRFSNLLYNACAKTVAVVVPSPAKSLVLKLLLYHLSTHVFNGSFNSISFATVTPSLVTFGPPKLFNNITTFWSRVTLLHLLMHQHHVLIRHVLQYQIFIFCHFLALGGGFRQYA